MDGSLTFGLMPRLLNDDVILQYWEIGTVVELDDLRRKLATRKGRVGFEENCREIEARIAELEKAETETE